jgi:hypothetical protein
VTAHDTEPDDPRVGPEDAAPHLGADEARAGSSPPEADPGTVPAPGTSEEAEPVRGLHVPDIDEDGPTAPGRYRAEGHGAEAVERATDS